MSDGRFPARPAKYRRSRNGRLREAALAYEMPQRGAQSSLDRWTARNRLSILNDAWALIDHVTDPNVEVRQAVVESLDEFDDPAVTAALRTALRDTNAEVRQSAVKALGNRNKSK